MLLRSLALALLISGCATTLPSRPVADDPTQAIAPEAPAPQLSDVLRPKAKAK